MDGDFMTHGRMWEPTPLADSSIREICSELRRLSGREWVASQSSLDPQNIKIESSIEAAIGLLHWITIIEKQLKEKTAYIENLNKIIEGFIASVEHNKLKNGASI